MNTTKKIITTLAFSAMTMGGVAATAATPAFAGSNGQQVKLCPGPVMAHGVARVKGVNQGGIFTASPQIGLPARGKCAQLHGYWWVGRVTVIWRSPHGHVNTRSCSVPKSTGDGDYIKCFGA